jgi:multidrug resistance efflux pump
MKLRTKKSHFQNLPEGRAPRTLTPLLLKYAYYLALIGVVIGIIYVVGLRYLYFRGRGQVEIEKTKISSEYGGRIEAIRRQAGDSFSAGDILAVIDTGIECAPKPSDARLIRLVHDIELNQSELDIYTKRFKELADLQDLDILPRALEIGNVRSHRQPQEISREMDRLKEKTDLLSAEIAIKRKELADLEKDLAARRDAFCGLETIRSAFAGRVYRVMHRPSEYVKKGEPLFVLTAKEANVLVEAFFDRKDIRYLAGGRKMTIEFPDRTTSQGQVIDYLSSASYYADRTEKNYLPVEAKLRVNLKPVATEEIDRWKRYDRMDVMVTGERK